MAFCEHTCKWKDGTINFQYCNESVDGQHPRSKLLRQINKKYSPERDSIPIRLLTLRIVTNIEAAVYNLAFRLSPAPQRKIKTERIRVSRGEPGNEASGTD